MALSALAARALVVSQCNPNWPVIFIFHSFVFNFFPHCLFSFMENIAAAGIKPPDPSFWNYGVSI